MQNQLNNHVPNSLRHTLKDGFIKLQVIPCKLTDSKRRNKSKHLKKLFYCAIERKMCCAAVGKKKEKKAGGLISIK